jgi:hypothetical protein
MLLQSRVKLLERVLWFHSIDVDSSIAKLQAGENLLGRQTGNVSLLAEPSQEYHEPDGALCSKESFGLEDDGEASYFGSTSGRVELLKSNGCMLLVTLPPQECFLFCFQVLADDDSGCRYGTSSFTTVNPLPLEPVLSRD